MNKLTLNIQNRTRYKLKKHYYGDLVEGIDIAVLDMDEYIRISGQETEKDVVILFENIATSVAKIIEKYLATEILTECLSNDSVGASRQEKIVIYIKSGLGNDVIENIIEVLSRVSLLIEHSCAFHLDDAIYKCGKSKVLGQPLDAVIVQKSVNDSLTDADKEMFALEKNSKIIVVNLDNLRFEECQTFVADSNEGKLSVYDNSGVLKTIKEPVSDGGGGTNKIADNYIWVAPYIQRKLRINNTDSLDNLMIIRVKGYDFDKINVVEVDKVADSIVQMSANVYGWLQNELPDNINYCLVNKYSGARMFIDREKLEKNERTSNSIQLNYFHRNILGLNPSSEVARKILSAQYFRDRGVDLNYVEELANDETSDEYYKSLSLTKILADNGYKRVRIFPEFDTYGTLRRKKRIVRDMTRAYVARAVGRKSIDVRCARPYNVDEIGRIVRLSADKISILGIEPSDFVVLRYNNKKVRARVLPFDVNNDWKEIQLTNLVGGDIDKAEIETMVGIPATLRSQLGIPDVNVCVTVERDTDYMFSKTKNMQFLPIVALVFSVFDLCNSIGADVLATGWRLLLALGITLLFTPLVLYIMLSGERAKVKVVKSIDK